MYTTETSTRARVIWFTVVALMLAMVVPATSAGANDDGAESEPYEASVPLIVLEEDGSWGQTPIPAGASATMSVGGEPVAWSDHDDQVEGTLTPGDEYVVEAVAPEDYMIVSCWDTILEYQLYPMNADVGTFTAPSRDSSDPYTSDTSHWVCITESSSDEPPSGGVELAFEATPSHVVADGVDVLTLTITVTDGDGPREQFSLGIGDFDGMVTVNGETFEGNAATTTDADGVGVFQLTTTVAGTQMLEVFGTGMDGVPYEVAFVAPDQDPAPPGEPTFGDVGTDHPFLQEIEWLIDEGITDGYDDGTFRPGRTVSRQAMAAFMYRLSGEPEGPFDDPGFVDVPLSHPFHTQIAWMAEEEITGGYQDGTFRPSGAITRQAASAFFYRLQGSPDGPFENPGFVDVPVGHQFFTAITWMAEEGITGGYQDGTFRPGNDVTRQATAAFMYRLAGLGPGEPDGSGMTVTFCDVGQADATIVRAIA